MRVSTGTPPHHAEKKVYITIDELKKSIPFAELIQLSNDENRLVEEIDLTNDTDACVVVINEAIADAETLINGYISQRYPVPLATVPQLLKTVCRDITNYNLRKRRNPDNISDSIEGVYKTAIKTLEAIRDNKLNIGIEVPGASSTGTGIRTNKTSKSRIFGRQLVADQGAAGSSVLGDIVSIFDSVLFQISFGKVTIKDRSIPAGKLVDSYEPANENIQAHISDTDNPHGVTKGQLGLDEVDNTADVDKPISNAVGEVLSGIASSIQAIWEALSGKASATHNHNGTYEPANVNIQAHISNTGNPHNVTKSQVGLDKVDNTADSAKPISTIQQNALDGKEPIINAGTTAQYYRGDKTWRTLDKTAVGLPNVDNTADSAKPVSTAQADAISKAPYVIISRGLQSQNPAASTTYYFGGTLTSLFSSGGYRRLPITKTGIITSVSGCFFASPYGSAHTSTLYVRVNNANDYLVSNGILLSATVNTFHVNGLTIPVSAGDYIEFKLVTGAFTTLPQGVWSEIMLGVN